MEKGHEVHLIGFRHPNVCEDVFKTFSICKTNDQFINAVRMHRDADIFHIHTEPYNLVMLTREAGITKPIILDVHDSMEWRSDNPEERVNEERIAMGMVEGMVFPSEKCKEITAPTIPHCVLPPYVNKRFYKNLDHLRTGGGGVCLNGKCDGSEEIYKFMGYANYEDIAKEFRAMNIPFHIYTVWKNQKHMDFYKPIAEIKPTLNYNQLLKSLGHHDWGICGNTKWFKEWSVAMPNKLFEYMAAGIPIIAMNCEEVEKFVSKYGVGICVKSVKEIADRWEERYKCVANVFKYRQEFIMENRIGVVEDLMRSVCQK